MQQKKESRESHSNPGLNTATPPRPTPPSARPPRSGSWEPVPWPESPALRRRHSSSKASQGWGRKCSLLPPRQTQSLMPNRTHRGPPEAPQPWGTRGLQPGSPESTGAARPQREECPPARAPWGGHCSCKGTPVYSRSGGLQNGKRPAGDCGLVGPGPDPRGGRQAKHPRSPIPGDMGPKPRNCDFSQDRNRIFSVKLTDLQMLTAN